MTILKEKDNWQSSRLKWQRYFNYYTWILRQLQKNMLNEVKENILLMNEKVGNFNKQKI